MLLARGSWRLFMDADNSTSLDQFQNMLPYLEQDLQVVIGSRAVKGARLMPRQPLYRQILGKIGNKFIQILATPGIMDTQCGFKCFSAEAATRVFQLTRIDGWGFDVEVLVLARHFGYKIKEIPVTWVNDIRSKVSLAGYVSTLWDVVRVRWWLLCKGYDLSAVRMMETADANIRQ
jgi:dolichyl-phosphate beta-glucosyltransferase